MYVGEESMRQPFWKRLSQYVFQRQQAIVQHGGVQDRQDLSASGKVPPWNEAWMHTKAMSLEQKRIIRECFSERPVS